VAWFTENREGCWSFQRLGCAAVLAPPLPPFGDVSFISPHLSVVKRQLQSADVWPRSRESDPKALGRLLQPRRRQDRGECNSSSSRGWLGRRNFCSLELLVPDSHPQPPGMQDIPATGVLQIKAAVPPTSCEGDSPRLTPRRQGGRLAGAGEHPPRWAPMLG